MPKKILMIISDLGSGGAQKNFTFVANLLARNDFDLSILKFNNEKSFFKIDNKIKIYNLNLLYISKNIFQKITYNVYRIFKIRRFIKKKCPNIIISFMNQTNILTILASMMTNSKVIISDRNNPKKQPDHFFWKLLRFFIYKKANLLIVNSQEAFYYYQKNLLNKNIKLINNPIEYKGTYRSKKKIILSVSRLHKQKSLETLLFAFSKFIQKNKSWKLIIIGKGEEDVKLKKISKELFIENKVSWINQTKDIDKYYKIAQIFCLTSRYEGFSNSLLEALSHNLNCVVSESAISQNKNIHQFITTFKTTDSEDLLKKLNTVLTQKKQIDSAELINKEFSKDKIVKDWIDCLG